MINIRQNPDGYQPTAVYNRKLLRNMIRTKCWNDKSGNVNKRVGLNFHKLKDKQEVAE